MKLAANVTFYRFYTEVDNVKIWGGSSIPVSDIKNIDYTVKPPILLLHGLFSNIGTWVRNIQSLKAHDNPVFAIDLPGFGLSTRMEFPIDHNESEQLFCRIIYLWLIKMELTKVILIGHSFGGYISCSFATLYPEKVESIVLLDPWGIIETKNYLVEKIANEGLYAFRKIIFDTRMMRGRIFKMMLPLLPSDVLRFFGKHHSITFLRTFESDICDDFAKDLGEKGPYIWAKYIYAINSLHPRQFCYLKSGEIAFTSMIDYSLNAKNPIMERLDKLSYLKRIYFLYGEESHLDYLGGHLVG